MKLNNEIRSLLVAEDDVDDFMFLQAAIQSFTNEINISRVQDGARLLSFLSTEKIPDLIILDINMPKIGGIECLRKIRSQPVLSGIPVVMYSTSSNSDIIEKCFQLGASRYIIKPMIYDDIVKLMQMILCVDWKNAGVVKKENFLIDTDSINQRVNYLRDTGREEKY